jgi:hypothetical protein
VIPKKSNCYDLSIKIKEGTNSAGRSTRKFFENLASRNETNNKGGADSFRARPQKNFRTYGFLE